MTLPFQAFPWGSRSKVTWLTATDKETVDLTSEVDRGVKGTFHSVTKRIDHLALETTLGKFTIFFLKLQGDFFDCASGTWVL